MYTGKIKNRNAYTMTGEKVQFLTVVDDPRGKNNDVYVSKRDPVPDRWKGKQLMTAPPKKMSAAQEGVFGKFQYPGARGEADGKNVEPYNDKGPRPKRPEKGFPSGFGAGDPVSRDKLSLRQEMERFREILRREQRHTDKALDEQARRVERETMGMTGDAADTGLKPTRRLGAHSVSSGNYGWGIHEMTHSRPQFAKKSAVSHFADRSHLDG